jgi:hypothetical protein
MSEKSIESDMEFDNTPPEITNMLLLRVHGRGENTVRYSVRFRTRYILFFRQNIA